MSYEKIFVVGGTGNIGTRTVKDLLQNESNLVTVYARSPKKVRQLFHSPPNLSVIQGDYTDVDLFEKSISGHTRLFLLVHNPELHDMAKYNTALAERAYAAGVKQIVMISGLWAAFPYRSSFIGNAAYEAETAIAAIPNRGMFVTLRPSIFMTNHLWIEIHTIKNANTIFGTIDPDAKEPWISTNDIGEVAATILQDPILKHRNAVYEMIGDVKSPKERASILSKVLGKEITYTQIADQERYEYLTKEVAMEHIKAYDMLLQPWSSETKVSPGFSILLGRQPEGLENWFEKNKAAFL
ncbi:hypothetical protein BDA99DRAFT_584907 [Phascolomyces articulosus]|uniref:NmrA-like domain-containing protein n=1 Tax=Phascolomyces articulosus TaxID=60185 RepID=A0AAD5JW80_9FUNG|nr:hypothetical protein BDA99DRAFT_584907 [Phascolomyces articulosus]